MPERSKQLDTTKTDIRKYKRFEIGEDGSYGSSSDQVAVVAYATSDSNYEPSSAWTNTGLLAQWLTYYATSRKVAAWWD
jgi:hypothetical protein